MTTNANMATARSHPMGTPAVCVRTGLTYRQIDWWIRAGIIKPEHGDAIGSGARRYWTADEVDRLHRIARVLRLFDALGMVRSFSIRPVVETLWAIPLDEGFEIEGERCRLVVEP